MQIFRDEDEEVYARLPNRYDHMQTVHDQNLRFTCKTSKVVQIIPVPHPLRNLPVLKHLQYPFLNRPGLRNNS